MAPRYKKEKAPVSKQAAIVMSSKVRDKVELRKEILVSLFLVVMVLIPYGQVVRFDFVNFDDNQYVTENARISAGLTYDNIVWAFTTWEATNWHPLTWLSYLLDAQLFGAKNAPAFHLVNVLFHAANSVLLFLLLHRMTRALWASMLVAALFAVHPLHVESVAWISERKDVLSTFFWLLTMIAYLRYVASPGFRYLFVVLPFALGLMAKSMLVSLPAVLLLMDYWPLRRLESGDPASGRPAIRWQWLIIEKLPLVALAVVTSILTVLAQEQAVWSLKQLPVWLRAANAVVSYVRYIAMTIMPIDLIVFYPHPSYSLPFWQVIVAVIVLVSVSVFVVWFRKICPYLLVGWLWYLGTLIPVIGFVQAGLQALADRYTYVPLIGLFIMLIWTAQDLAVRWRIRPIALGFGATGILIALTAGASMQVSHWRNNTTLFEHVLQVDPSNYLAHKNLGGVLFRQKHFDEAKVHFMKVLEVMPTEPEAHDSLARVLINQGNYEEARAHLLEAIKLKPDYENPYCNLGAIFVHQGRIEEAKVQFMKALKLKPDYFDALNNLGVAFANQGHSDEAKTYFRKALKVKPDAIDTRNNLTRLESADTAPKSAPKDLGQTAVPPRN